jgi:hypothetical protein
MHIRRAVLVAALLYAVGGVEAAPPEPKPEAKPAPKPAAAPANDRETEAFLRQMGDAQKWMGEEIWKLQRNVEALPAAIAEVKEGHTTTQEEVDKLREEVKGLYVELSTVKSQIEDVKEDIKGVNGNLSAFRTSSGLFLAFVVLMVVVSTGIQVMRR